jgi:hypothetical protein
LQGFGASPERGEEGANPRGRDHDNHGSEITFDLRWGPWAPVLRALPSCKPCTGAFPSKR